MKILLKRKVFICILVSLLLCGLTQYVLLPNVIWPSQLKASRFDVFQQSPPNDDRENYPVHPSLWQVNSSSIACVQSITLVDSKRATIVCIGGARCMLHSYLYDANSQNILPRFSVISRDTVFKFADGSTTFQYLDIPPPYN